MNKILVLGLGPGHIDYILPVVMKKINESEVLIAGKRNIESIKSIIKNQEIIYINKELNKIIEFIKNNRNKKISILLSGDTGFYSFLTYLKKYFENEEIETICGISSLQYFFSKINETWNDAFLSSFHGRDFNLIEKLNEYNKIGILTDNKNTPQEIAKLLIGINNIEIYVGENLSYENEKISKYSVKDLINESRIFDMNVVIIKKSYKKI